MSVEIGATDTHPGRVAYTISASQPEWPSRPDASQSPNVIVVLVDDMGYSDVGCFGSEIPTPEIDALAADGVRMRNFHTAPICSPTRAALLTGRNPHRAGFGRVASFDPGFPGYSMQFPDDTPTLASEMRNLGYATFAVGKWHLAREIEQSAAGSRHAWPLQQGFDRFYGFLDGFTNFHHPHQLTEDNHHLAIDEFDDDYYLTDDLTERASTMIKELRAGDPDKPFFLYLAHGAVHAPLQAPASDIARFSGAYDAGWDEIRAQRFRRQQELGVVDRDTELPPADMDLEAGVPAWADLSEEERLVAARHMEVYAAMVATVDRSIGELRRTLQALGEWEDTVVVFMSDNGASSDVGPTGTMQYMLGHGMPVPDDVPDGSVDAVEIGGPRHFTHYASGWAKACNTPFRLFKRFTHAGGHSVPFVMRWGRGELPSAVIQDGYAHVSDLMPTLLELVGSASIPKGLDGRSFAEALRDGRAETRTEQLFESHGNRGLYSNGWEIVSMAERLEPYTDATWELYHLAEDPTELSDLAGEDPQRVAGLSQRWHELAAQGDVFPLEDGAGVFFHQRPDFHRPTERAVFMPGIATVERIRARDLIWNRSFSIDVLLGEAAGHEGTLVAHGDQAAGYSLHVANGELRFAVNLGGQLTEIAGGHLGDGSQVRVRVDCPAINVWDVTIDVDGETRGVGEKVPTHTGLMTPLHGIDIGICRGSPIVWSIYEEHRSFPWSGDIQRVVYTPRDFAPDAPQLRVEEFREWGIAVAGMDQPLTGPRPEGL